MPISNAAFAPGSSPTVQRPVARAFDAGEAPLAVAWARNGGHALLREAPGRLVWLARVPLDREETALARFALLDLGRQRFGRPSRGSYAGLLVVRVATFAAWVLERRVLRDVAHAVARVSVAFDCTRCGACCRDNEVTLGPVDVRRLRDAGYSALRARGLVRYQGGKLRLALAPGGACVLLGADQLCQAYQARPMACRAFPMGSEPCLSARA